jgi:hypothetical protein
VSEASCRLGRLVEFGQGRDSFSDRSTRTAFATEGTEITPDSLAHVKCGGSKPKMASGRRGQAQHRPAERDRISREWDLFPVVILTRCRERTGTPFQESLVGLVRAASGDGQEMERVRVQVVVTACMEGHRRVRRRHGYPADRLGRPICEGDEPEASGWQSVRR